MHHRSSFSALLLVGGAALLTLAAPANAGTVTLTGTRENINPLLPPGSGSCAPTYFNTVIITPGNFSSTGTSNLGNFTSTQQHCIVSAPPTPFVNGIFTYDFGSGATLTGTYSGTMALTATPGFFDTVENLIVTGGTGVFAGATGTITTNGTLHFGLYNGVNSGFYSGTVLGSITAPGVPEPTSWAMMTIGLGLAGAAMRRGRRNRPAFRVA